MVKLVGMLTASLCLPPGSPCQDWSAGSYQSHGGHRGKCFTLAANSLGVPAVSEP